ncbi:ferric reductase-like transmembrane domain-containing protein [Phytohabitans kaempferiae]|uniref:Ferric reductase-like transmembrane domain-containing protein n=1 Tax=Phytohabitans kaempferiae TaxID=1620943 RepID=A0ABV6MDB8_9ACTN
MPDVSLWHVARASGFVSTLLLTATVLLGILGPMRVGTPSWPRFTLAGLHRNISLLTLVLLAIHLAAVAIDSYVPITWADLVVPFVSAYHPFWLGLGTVSFDILLALLVTSLLRPRINPRLWRVLHWSAYLCWPLALVHGLGIGTDALSGWPLGLSVFCTAAVLAGVGWRVIAARKRILARLS